MQFSVSETTNGTALNYNFAPKNVNTTSEVMRMGILGGSSGSYSYIINLGTSTFYIKVNDGTWTPIAFNTDSAYIIAFSDYQAAPINWIGYDPTYTYSTASASIVISAIQVNPTFPNSLFSTS